ncbi:alpha/beta hydrolase [Streptomyces sp. NBC_00988]|uniref:alpha/beta fold hydrolase n=1 Tax=Streptomyces sp. NBC_00988 TaxID=2903704 RepID=UPI00386C2E7F|nr:alpha/beta hydrolase [Streptomyces sp. NBC_00988]
MLLHGASSSRRAWSTLLPVLAGRLVVAVDVRGHGESGFPDGPLDRADVSRDVATVLDDLDIARAAVIGASLGAALAVNLSAQRPDLVAGLVLEDPPLRAGTEPASYVQEMRHNLSRAAALTPAQLLDEVRRAMPEASEDAVRIVAEDRAKFDPRFVEYGLDWFVRPWRRVFAEAPFRITVLAGDPERGSIVTYQEEAECVRLLGRDEVRRIPGAGHVVRRDAPTPYAQAVVTALEGIDSTEEDHAAPGGTQSGGARPGE